MYREKSCINTALDVEKKLCPQCNVESEAVCGLWHLLQLQLVIDNIYMAGGGLWTVDCGHHLICCQMGSLEIIR